MHNQKIPKVKSQKAIQHILKMMIHTTDIASFYLPRHAPCPAQMLGGTNWGRIGDPSGDGTESFEALV